MPVNGLQWKRATRHRRRARGGSGNTGIGRFPMAASYRVPSQKHRWEGNKQEDKNPTPREEGVGNRKKKMRHGPPEMVRSDADPGGAPDVALGRGRWARRKNVVIIATSLVVLGAVK